MTIDIFSLRENQMNRTQSCLDKLYGRSTSVEVTDNSIFKSEEQLAIQSLEVSERTDQILKGRSALPVGTRKTYGGKEFVKTAQGWKASKEIKDAHDKIHGKKEDASTKPVHERTVQEHIDVSKKEAGEYYSSNMDGELSDEHYKGIEDHIKSGGKISRKVHDSLDSGKQFHFNKHYNSGHENKIKEDKQPKMNKVDFERAVTDHLIEKLDIPNGDAQGIIEAKQDVLDESFKAGLSVEETAEKIDKG